MCALSTIKSKTFESICPCVGSTVQKNFDFFLKAIIDLKLNFHSLFCFYWPAHPDDPQGIRVASVIEFSVCLSVCLSVLIKFSNFWPPSRDCSACTIEFAVGVNLKTHYQTNCNECFRISAGVNLKTHDTFRGTVRLYDILAHSTQWSTGLQWPP